MPRAGRCTAQLAPNGGPSCQGLRAMLGGQGPTERNSRGHWCCARTKRGSPQERPGALLTHVHAHCTRTHCTHAPPTCARNGSLPGAPPCTPPREQQLSTPLSPYTRRLPPPHCTGTLLGGIPHAPLCAPRRLSLPGQHSRVHLGTSACGARLLRVCSFPSPRPIPKLLRPQCRLP